MRDLLSLLKKVSKSKRLDEDATQEAFVKLLEDRPDLLDLPETELSALVARIALNAQIDASRKWGYRVRRFEGGDAGRAQTCPERAYLRRELRALCAEIVEAMPAGRERCLVQLVYFDDLSIAEAARALGIERGAAKMALYRGRRRFEALLLARRPAGDATLRALLPGEVL